VKGVQQADRLKQVRFMKQVELFKGYFVGNIWLLWGIYLWEISGCFWGIYLPRMGGSSYLDFVSQDGPIQVFSFCVGSLKILFS
jgi:hypothetical protein